VPRITRQLSIPDHEIRINPIRAQGPGGQHVNKVASAVQLRFDIPASSLPPEIKQRLLGRQDRRISKAGVLVIKADQYRRQEQNRDAALQRLVQLVRQATSTQKKRLPTTPTRNSQRRRLDSKSRRGRLKVLRARVSE
jgi:ribosome-associated protein